MPINKSIVVYPYNGCYAAIKKNELLIHTTSHIFIGKTVLFHALESVLVVVWVQEWIVGIDCKGTQGILWGHGIVLYFDCGFSYTDLIIYQYSNSPLNRGV